jgi:hypothetical protein
MKRQFLACGYWKDYGIECVPFFDKLKGTAEDAPPANEKGEQEVRGTSVLFP